MARQCNSKRDGKPAYAGASIFESKAGGEAALEGTS